MSRTGHRQHIRKGRAFLVRVVMTAPWEPGSSFSEWPTIQPKRFHWRGEWDSADLIACTLCMNDRWNGKPGNGDRVIVDLVSTGVTIRFRTAGGVDGKVTPTAPLGAMDGEQKVST
jgi:hypothetical protein